MPFRLLMQMQAAQLGLHQLLNGSGLRTLLHLLWHRQASCLSLKWATLVSNSSFRSLHSSQLQWQCLTLFPCQPLSALLLTKMTMTQRAADLRLTEALLAHMYCCI